MEFEFVLPRIFGNDVTIEKNVLKLPDNFNIFTYPLSVREIFYKYFPEILRKYGNNTIKYNSKSLEHDLLNDTEMLFIPMNLIDLNIIKTKTFEKILSQDYDIINNYKNENFKLSNYLTHLIRYKPNVFSSLKNIDTDANFIYNVNIYANFLDVVDIVDSLPESLDVLYSSCIINFINKINDPLKLTSKQTQHEYMTHIINRFCNKETNSLSDELWNNSLSNKSKLAIAIYYCNKRNKFLTNLITDEDLIADYNFFMNIYGNGSLRYLQPEIIPFFERCVTNDKYKGEWVLVEVDPLEYDKIEIDNIKYRLNENGIKEEFVFQREKSCLYYISKLVKYFANKLTSEILYKEFITHKYDLASLFDIHDANIREIMLNSTPINMLKDAFNCELTINEYKYMSWEEVVKLKSITSTNLSIFNIYNNDVLETMLNSIDENVPEFVSAFNELLIIEFMDNNHSNKSKFGELKHPSHKFINYFINLGFNKNEVIEKSFNEQIFNLIKYSDEGEYILNYINEKDPFFIYKFIRSLIENKKLTKEICTQLINKFVCKEHGLAAHCGNTNLAKLGLLFIKHYHSEPYLELYPEPDFVDENQRFRNTASTWSQYVNRETIPKEMTSVSFYRFMVKCNGKKKNENYASCYSFFSNSLENKIIFCKSNYELNLPATLRFEIPIEFNKVKRFLHEKIETNDICMFSKLTQDDWDKISGGDKTIDCVVFSDSKNVYRQRTPLSKVIDHLINSVEIEYEVEVYRNDEL